MRWCIQLRGILLTLRLRLLVPCPSRANWIISLQPKMPRMKPTKRLSQQDSIRYLVRSRHKYIYGFWAQWMQLIKIEEMDPMDSPQTLLTSMVFQFHRQSSSSSFIFIYLFIVKLLIVFFCSTCTVILQEHENANNLFKRDRE